MSRESVQAAREYEETAKAFAYVRESMISRLLASGVGESLLRDKLVLTVQALDEVQGVLLGMAQSGDVEAHADALRALFQDPAA
jgi:hypothetical protein